MSLDIELSHLRQNRAARFLTEDYNGVNVPLAGPSPGVGPGVVSNNADEDIPEIFAHQHQYNYESEHTYESALIKPRWKRELFELLEHPTSSTGAFLVHILITSLILASAFVTVMETVPAFHSIQTSVWFGVETSLVALFTVEYIARCVAWSGSWTSLFRWVVCAFFLSLPSFPNSYVGCSILRDYRLAIRRTLLYRNNAATRYCVYTSFHAL
jgi:hypothetical protein